VGQPVQDHLATKPSPSVSLGFQDGDDAWPNERRSAGVSAAIFLIRARYKKAGGMPALRKSALPLDLGGLNFANRARLEIFRTGREPLNAVFSPAQVEN